MSDAWCDQCDRYYDPSKEHDCRAMAPEEAQANRLPHAWKPAWKHAAEAGGTPPASYVLEPIETHAVFTLRTPRIATLPTGERVELPAGTVLREGTLPPEAEDDRPTLGEQIHDEHDRALRDLTERVGLPREMAPSVAFLDGFNEGMKAAQAEAAGGMATSTIAEAFRLAIGADGGEAAASVEPGPEART